MTFSKNCFFIRTHGAITARGGDCGVVKGANGTHIFYNYLLNYLLSGQKLPYSALRPSEVCDILGVYELAFSVKTKDFLNQRFDRLGRG